MKSIRFLRTALIVLLALPLLFSACIKDSCRQLVSFKYRQPVYRTKDEVRANIKSNTPRDLKHPGKLYLFGKYIFLNEFDKGIHVIDNSNPASPRKVAFIDIPGNIDLAAKGNILYADCYTDLVAIDISDAMHARVSNIIDYVFPERYYADGFVAANGQVISEWIERDTTIVMDCNSYNVAIRNTDVLQMGPGNFAANGGLLTATSSQPGIGGSLARFTIVGNHMFSVDHHTLRTISLASPANPQVTGEIMAGFDIETIYPFNNRLFLGSMGGLFIYDIGNPNNPVKLGEFSHARACDPVVADNDYAYVTLRSGTNCGPTADEMLVLNVQNLQSPSLVRAYPMTSPQGLSKDQGKLFVCDGPGGLKYYEASDPTNLQLLKTITGLKPVEVIAWNKLAIVVADDGLYQFDYSDPANIRQLSKLTITQ